MMIGAIYGIALYTDNVLATMFGAILDVVLHMDSVFVIIFAVIYGVVLYINSILATIIDEYKVLLCTWIIFFLEHLI